MCIYIIVLNKKDCAKDFYYFPYPVCLSFMNTQEQNIFQLFYIEICIVTNGGEEK